jgi:hypothetical protein
MKNYREEPPPGGKKSKQNSFGFGFRSKLN